MSCGMSVRAFFAPFIQRNLINPKPVAVAESSVNSFKPKFLKQITALGMPVVSVLGYTDDPLLFVKVGNPQQDVYGVVVKEGIGNVQAQLKSYDVTDARTFRIDAKSTLILCKGEPQ